MASLKISKAVVIDAKERLTRVPYESVFRPRCIKLENI